MRHAIEGIVVVKRVKTLTHSCGAALAFCIAPALSPNELAAQRPGRGQAEQRAAAPVVLEGLTLIDMTGAPPRPMMSVRMEDGRITDLYRTGSKDVAQPARVVDLRGTFAIPGLIDGHVHLTAPFERAGQQDSISHFLLMGGVTAIRDMAGHGDMLRERARAAAAASAVSPRIFYSTVVAGPEFLRTDRRALSLARQGTPGQMPWARSVNSDSDATAAVAAAAGIGATGIKAYAELSAPLLGALVRAAHARGLKVWAHAAVIPAKPSDAVAAGVDVLSHAFMLVLEDIDSLPPTYVAGVDLSEVGRHPVESPVFARLLSAMSRRGTMLDPNLYVASRLARSSRVLRGDLSYLRGVDEWSVKIARLARDAGVRFVAGTDVFGYPGQDSFPTLHEELAIYVEQVGMAPAEALATATRNAAEVLGAERDLGTIAVGKFAARAPGERTLRRE